MRLFALVAFAWFAGGRFAAGVVSIAGKGRVALALLERTTMALRGNGTNAVGAAAVDYLRLFALVAYGWMWVRMATAAAGDTPQHNAKRAVADYFVERTLPQAQALAASVAAGEETIMADRKSTRLNPSHSCASRLPSSAYKKKNN